MFNLQRRSKCRRGKEEKKGAQKETASIEEKVAREVREMRKEMMFHIKDDGMEVCLCVRLLQVGGNLNVGQETISVKC